jgi:hypothetical protein
MSADAPVQPQAGDWVLFRNSERDRVAVDMKQAAKVTPSLVKFDGGYPRQCHILSVVAWFADKQVAENVRDSIGGIAGEFNRRRRLAEDERSRRITQALVAANQQVARVIAAATPSRVVQS